MLEITSLFISTMALCVSLVSYYLNVKHDMKKDTIDAYNQLQEQALDKLNEYMPSQIIEIIENKKSEEGKYEYKKLQVLIARIEHFCVGVNEKIYDINTLKAMANGYFNGYTIRKRIEPFINDINKETSEYYKNITTVWQKMEGK